MKLIQTILILGLLSSLAVYFIKLRSSLLDRLLATAIFIIGLSCILFPTLAQWFAEQVGVGRGTDLFFYIFSVGSIFVGILFYSRVHKLELALTEVIRELALKKPVKPEENSQ